MRYGSGGFKALANRRGFYIDAARYPDYCEFPLGEEVSDSNGGKRRRVRIDEAWPEQYLRRCVPHVVIFPEIKPQAQSTLRSSDSVRALKLLLAQSGPQLFDRSTMAQHLDLLKRLLQQTETYELTAGRDLYHKPAKLMAHARSARREKLARIVIELTNRRNLSCRHCFEERHAATGDLPLEVLQKVFREGKSCGIEQVSFTGGEPTIHRQFEEIINHVAEAGYLFSFVSNGVSFPRIYSLLVKRGKWFLGVTFSLMGREKTPMIGYAAKDRFDLRCEQSAFALLKNCLSPSTWS